MDDELRFKIQRLGTAIAMAKGVRVDPERFIVDEVADQLEILLNIATQEHDSFDYPATLWDYIKIKLLPRWLLRRYPATFNRVYTLHKFPEIDVSTIGREFVSFKIVPYQKLEQ